MKVRSIWTSHFKFQLFIEESSEYLAITSGSSYSTALAIRENKNAVAKVAGKEETKTANKEHTIHRKKKVKPPKAQGPKVTIF